MVFKNIFCNEISRITKSVCFYALTGLLIAFTLVVFIVSVTDKKADENEYHIYRVSEYETFARLHDDLTKAEDSLQKQIDSLEYEIGLNALTKEQIQFRRRHIDDSKLRVDVMRFLYAHEIPFNQAAQYNSLKSKCGVSVLNHCYFVVSIFFAFITLIRTSVALPNEIKEGQAKLTLTLPISRTRYALYRLLLMILLPLIGFFAYTLFALAVSCMFYPAPGTLIFASASGAFGAGAALSALIQFSFAFVLIAGVGVFTFAVSLLTFNKTVTFFISIPVCFGGKVIELTESLWQNDLFSKFLISANFFIQKSYSDASANGVALSCTILISYVSILLIAALRKFGKQDILN